MGSIDDQKVSLVVVTALPVEQVAVKQVLDEVDGEVDGFIFGSVMVDGAVAHRLVIGLLPQTGNTTAASAVSDWAARFVNAKYLVMVGIAGGIPSPGDPEKDVRLGDVVVPDSTGVREHDRGKLQDGIFQSLVGGTPAPSSQLVSITRQLIGGAIVGESPWQGVLAERFREPVWARPTGHSDVRSGEEEDSGTTSHPQPESKRSSEVPRLVAGLIASGNLVVKDLIKRDELARLGAVAVEMESAGVAATAWLSEREHFAVRGIVDYSDGTKNNDWHLYGSAAAAAVFRVILDRKSPTVNESPTSLLAIDGVQADYVADIRAAISSAIVEAEGSRAQVIEAVRHWQEAHESLNRRPMAYNADTGEPLPCYLPRQHVATLTEEVVAALTKAKASVGSNTAAATIAIDLLSDVADSTAAVKWLEALKRALDGLVAAASTWPAAPSGNKYEPPPSDDGGALASSVQAVRSTLSGTLRCLSGSDSMPPPEPEPIAEVEPSEVSLRIQYLHDLADRLAPYGRINTKQYSASDHTAAVAAAAEVLELPSMVLLNAGLGMFAELAARVARNATADEWEALIEEASQAQPLHHAVNLLRAYREVHEEAGSTQLSAMALEAATVRLAELPKLIEHDDFWDSTSGENARKLVRLWASADERHDPHALLGPYLQSSRTGLCRTLDLLASNIERTNQFTDQVRIVREVHDRFGDLSTLVRPIDVNSAIATFLPEVEDLRPSEVEDAPEYVRYAVQFREVFNP